MDERSVYAVVAGQVIQHLRAPHLSQAALAARAGVSTSALSRYENGQSLPDMYETRRLAHALGRTPAQFVEVVDQAFARTKVVAKKVMAHDTLNGVAAAALAGLAILGVVAILDEAQKKSRKKPAR